MICKARDKLEHPEQDRFSKAGANAEEQMAFYLRRSFRDDPEVWIFNDLRFESDDHDVCQIDHLVLHRSGFALIESKSVTTKVRIHSNGEWERLWNNHWHGMPSPINQVELQIKFLRDALNAYRHELLGKLFLGHLQMGFNNVPFEILVAISDTGSIDRQGDFPEVAKADMVPGRVREIVKRHKKARGLFNVDLNPKSNDGLFNFKDEEIEAMRSWLTEHHCPSSTKDTSPAQQQSSPKQEPAVTRETRTSSSSQVTQAVPAALGICKKCRTQSEILWGGHNYYWKCPSCGKNMPINEYCPNCRGKLMLRKEKQRFYKHCESCKGGESLYWEPKG